MGWFRKLVLVFCLVPLVEFIIFWALGDIIGLPITIAIILITGFIGAWLTRMQGMRTLLSYQKTIASGQLPHREAVDGILILLAGAVLLTPGFLTDFVGFSLLIPQIRDKVRTLVLSRLKGRFNIMNPTGAASPSQTATGKTQKTATGSSGDVINVESELIDE